MKRSRKSASRGKVRRRKRLWDQRRLKNIREEGKYVPEGFVPGLFLKRHKIELFFILVLIAGISGIVLLGPDKKAINEMRASVSSVIEEQSPHWQEAYPYGYKIIALTDRDIIHTSFDTLPEDLEINWKDLSVVRIQAKQFGNTDEKIKIVLPGINYAPAGVLNQTVTVAFVRKERATVRLTRFGDLEFVAEIIKDNGDQLFCLLGLRER